METQIDICATCQWGVENYASVIGTIPWCCDKHWHCRPGGPACDYMPRDAESLSKNIGGQVDEHE